MISRAIEKRRFAVYLPSDLRKQIEDSASGMGQSLSTWVERVATSYLDKENQRIAKTRKQTPSGRA